MVLQSLFTWIFYLFGKRLLHWRWIRNASILIHLDFLSIFTLTDFLVGDNEEETNSRIETFTKVFDSLVEERVQKIVKEKFEQSAKSPQPITNPVAKKEEVKELRNVLL